MRRVFLIMSILYFLRSITMYVTVLPVSSTKYYCSPPSNGTTIAIISKRVFQLMSGFGLSINGKHTYCGDYIYSGHTVMLVLGYLVISECKYTSHILMKATEYSNLWKQTIDFHSFRFAASCVSTSVGIMDNGHSRCFNGIGRTWPLHHRYYNRILYNNTFVLDISYVN